MNRNFYLVFNASADGRREDTPEKEFSFCQILMLYAAIVAGSIAPIVVISDLYLLGLRVAFEESGMLFAIVFAEVHFLISLLARYIGKISGKEKKKSDGLKRFVDAHLNTALIAISAFAAAFFAMLTSGINSFFTVLFFIYGLYAVIRIAVASAEK